MTTLFSIILIAGCNCPNKNKSDIAVTKESANTKTAPTKKPVNALDEARENLEKARLNKKIASIECKSSLRQAENDEIFAKTALLLAKESAAAKIISLDKELKQYQDRLEDTLVNFAQLKKLYGSRDLHTDTENILIAREERKIASMKKGIKELAKKNSLTKKYSLPMTIKKAELAVQDKKEKLKITQIKSKMKLNKSEKEVAKAEKALKKIEAKSQQKTPQTY